ncbi:LysE family translocator [Aquirhabdus parva]|uniref:LysE family translocator n=1 Tax=Aquirhabdus parva TaxID=2283318 RepID=A0A345P795_9GAMM|nr:LysE family translocator [Aquirhabdus parva]AXI03154.1 LysE family translocator [Aquirhabdus parva]
MISTYLPEFLTIALVHFLALIAPGPDFAVTISQTIRYGRRVGQLTALGIGSAISIHVLYTLLGVGALMHTSPQILHGVKILGAIYLLYLGWKLIRSQANTGSESDLDNLALANQAKRGAYLTGFFTNALNPKATLFFLAIFTTLISATTPMSVQIFYGVWMCIVTALWFILVSILFSQDKIRQAFLKQGHWFERIMGIVLIAFALKLVWQW